MLLSLLLFTAAFAVFAVTLLALLFNLYQPASGTPERLMDIRMLSSLVASSDSSAEISSSLSGTAPLLAEEVTLASCHQSISSTAQDEKEPTEALVGKA